MGDVVVSRALVEAMAQKNGLNKVKAKLVEECAELIRALARGGDQNIIEEMIDVEIMLAQMTHLLSDAKMSMRSDIFRDKIEHLKFLLELPDSSLEAELINEVS